MVEWVVEVCWCVSEPESGPMVVEVCGCVSEPESGAVGRGGVWVCE